MVKDSIEPTLDEVLQPGKNMLAAGYCMYGSSCTVQICWTFTFLTFTVKFYFWWHNGRLFGADIKINASMNLNCHWCNFMMIEDHVGLCLWFNSLLIFLKAFFFSFIYLFLFYLSLPVFFWTCAASPFQLEQLALSLLYWCDECILEWTKNF